MAKKKPISSKRGALKKGGKILKSYMSVDPNLDSSIIPEVFKKKTEEVNKFIEKHGLPA